MTESPASATTEVHASTHVEKDNRFSGQGTDHEPFIVDFLENDPNNPMNWSQVRKWFITSIVTLSVFAVTLTSSAYSVSPDAIMKEFDTSREVFILGVSLFVLGFAVGPVVWGPLVCDFSDICRWCADILG